MQLNNISHSLMPVSNPFTYMPLVAELLLKFVYWHSDNHSNCLDSWLQTRNMSKNSLCHWVLVSYSQINFNINQWTTLVRTLNHWNTGLSNTESNSLKKYRLGKNVKTSLWFASSTSGEQRRTHVWCAFKYIIKTSCSVCLFQTLCKYGCHSCK